MIRYLLAAAAVAALVSSPVLAQDADAASKTVITKSGPYGSHKKIIIKRHGDRYGALVRHHFNRDRMYGSSMRHHRMMGPEGSVVVKKRTVVRDRSY